jgi:hypothetical protein
MEIKSFFLSWECEPTVGKLKLIKIHKLKILFHWLAFKDRGILDILNSNRKGFVMDKFRWVN